MAAEVLYSSNFCNSSTTGAESAHYAIGFRTPRAQASTDSCTRFFFCHHRELYYIVCTEERTSNAEEIALASSTKVWHCQHYLKRTETPHVAQSVLLAFLTSQEIRGGGEPLRLQLSQQTTTRTNFKLGALMAYLNFADYGRKMRY